LGLIVTESVLEAADRAAEEIVRLLSGSTVSDRQSGIQRPIAPADIAILFRSRDSHREFEAALQRRSVATYMYKGLGFFDADEIQDALALLRFLAAPTCDVRAAAFMRSRLVRLSDEGVRRLAPPLAAALTCGTEPEAVRRLDADDQAVVRRIRSALPGWLARLDLVGPSELLDDILRETAYSIELRGPRRRQARENLKKFRGLVRRIQNHGYATLSRIAEHLDRLALGDESNAAVDATDAVQLMTVHAAKGLEFSVVFVVNLGRGIATTRAPIRVGTDIGDGPSVAVADYQSDADADARARDREETKRLLYVALTRARDRLYLSATLKDGAFRPGKGSLGEVLPDAVGALLVRARSERLVRWTSASGHVHLFSAAGSLEVR
jgi:ATP-dependent helicase/nuclease subunit A